MVLPHSLGLVDSPVQTWSVVLCEANDGLEEDGQVEDQAEDGVRGGKVLMTGASLVDLDDDEAGEQGGEPDEVEEEVYGCAGALLFGGVGRLENQGCLGDEQEAGRVEERVGGEEDELVGEYGAPYDGSEDPDAGLGERCGAWVELAMR